MIEAEKLKKNVCEEIDKHRDELIETGERLWKDPETGFKELNATKLVTQTFKRLKLPCRENLAVTGCRADLDSGVPGPVLALLGELDSVVLPSHPDASASSGAVHACGHNAQIANLVGAAIGLTLSGVTKHLSGKIAFIAVPAEEFLEVDFRLDLSRSKQIRYCGGKAEMIRIGVFDDVAAAMMIHAGGKYFYPASYNGFVMKKVTFIGKATHAGLSPEKGVNALYAANLALDAINAQRETFRDEDTVRVHGIITNGGGVVNIIPDLVTMEIQIRAKTMEAIMDTAAKVDRSARAGAMAMGGAVDIETVPGYMPLRNDGNFAELYSRNLKLLNPSANLLADGHRGASTDMGDLSQIMPVFHPYATGCSGSHHGVDFMIADPEKAYVEPAKLLAMTAIDLLYGDAAALRQIVAHKAPLTKEQYLEAMERMFSNERQDYAASPSSAKAMPHGNTVHATAME